MKVFYVILASKKNCHSAAINRIKLFQTGLKKKGVECNIVYVNILPFRYIGTLYSLFLLILYLLIFLLQKKKAVFIFYGESIMFRIFPILRKFNKIIVERNEFPTYMISQDVLSYRQTKFYHDFEKALKYCDGFITCSCELEKYYSCFLDRRCSSLVSPLIVDVNFFNRKKTELVDKISYCGDWGNNKDGVSILIRAFARIHSKHPNMRLSLIGGSTRVVEEQLIFLCRSLNIIDSVDFVRRISHEQMPDYLCNSALLALARPNNKQAAGGMPSKVAEYLATKRPVVLTNVGELHKYLKDGYNCYMAEPDSVESFAEKLDQALTDPDSAIIGYRGYQTVLQFDVLAQSKLLLDYLKSLTNV